jgi:hypothetical protein
MVNGFLGNVGYSVRNLTKTPLVVLVTVLSLGIGVGAVTAVFSFTNALLFRVDPAIEDPEGLGAVWISDGTGGLYGPTSYPDFQRVQRGVPAFETVALSGIDVRTHGERFEGSPLLLEVVTSDFFDVLGLRPQLGRTFDRGGGPARNPSPDDLHHAGRMDPHGNPPGGGAPDHRRIDQPQ